MPFVTAVKIIVNHVGPAGPIDYPIYLGTLPASDLQAITEVPSFAAGASHSDLAENIWDVLYDPAAGLIPAGGAAPGNILAPIEEEWQRPVDPVKLAGVAAYYLGKNEIMSNPILLASRDEPGTAINLISTTTSPNTGVEWVELEIVVGGGANAPLLVIDGQHRLIGMNTGTPALAAEPIPFLLLHDPNFALYDGPYLASTFSILTTSATDLRQPHKSWMAFAFGLGDGTPGQRGYTDYSLANPELRQAYETALFLASQDTILGEDNPIFYNRVRTNPSPGVGYGYMDEDGFAFDIIDLASRIQPVLFPQGAAPPLTPEECAFHISQSFRVLADLDPDAGVGDSRIFPQAGTAAFGPLVKAIFSEFLSCIATPPPAWGGLPATYADWTARLTAQGFDATGNGWDWRFDGTTTPAINPTEVGGGGNAGRNERIARSCLNEYLRNGPVAGAANLPNFMIGDQGSIGLWATPASPAGRAAWAGRAAGYPANYSDSIAVPAAVGAVLPAFTFDMNFGAVGFTRDIFILTHSRTPLSRRAPPVTSSNIEIQKTEWWRPGVPAAVFDMVGEVSQSVGQRLLGGGLGLAVGDTITVRVTLTSFSTTTERSIEFNVDL